METKDDLYIKKRIVGGKIFIEHEIFSCPYCKQKFSVFNSNKMLWTRMIFRSRWMKYALPYPEPYEITPSSGTEKNPLFIHCPFCFGAIDIILKEGEWVCSKTPPSVMIGFA